MAMVRLSAPMPDGGSLTLDVAVLRRPPACFALGVRKSGSSIFHSIVAALAAANGWNVVDLPGTAFEAGWSSEDWIASPALRRLVWRGNAYVGFRAPPIGLYADPVFREARKILLVRDPHDALVSEWFSNRWSHALPTVGARLLAAERERALAHDLDAYVVARAPQLDRTVAGYASLLGDPTTLVQRYEEVILAKPDWVRAIAAHFGWAADGRLVADIVGWADVVPETEDPRAFIRRVRPGDGREKLSPAARQAVSRHLSGIWRELGYD